MSYEMWREGWIQRGLQWSSVALAAPSDWNPHDQLRRFLAYVQFASMKPGFCYVAERAEPSQAVRRIIASFSRVGIVLANSHTGSITEFAEDGEQVETTEAGLLQAAAARSELTFQLWWFSSDVDVICCFRQIAPGVVRHGYSVDGLDAQERERLMRWVVEYFREAVAEETAVLLVVDPPGTTADVDWDAVVRQTIPFPAVLPAILGLPASWMRHLGDHSGYSRQRIAEFELLRSPSDRE